MNDEIKHYYSYFDHDEGCTVIHEHIEDEPLKGGRTFGTGDNKLHIKPAYIKFTSEDPYMFLLGDMKTPDSDEAWQHYMNDEWGSFYHD